MCTYLRESRQFLAGALLGNYDMSQIRRLAYGTGNGIESNAKLADNARHSTASSERVCESVIERGCHHEDAMDRGSPRVGLTNGTDSIKMLETESLAQ